MREAQDRPALAATARRPARAVREAVRFLVVGGAATLVALVIFNGLVHGLRGDGPGPMHGSPLVAYCLANFVGMIVSYWGVRAWAFRSRTPVGVAGGRLNYLLVNTASMLIPLLCLTVSRYVLHLDTALADNISANVLGLAAATATRFWASRRFVFRPADA